MIYKSPNFVSRLILLAFFHVTYCSPPRIFLQKVGKMETGELFQRNLIKFENQSSHIVVFLKPAKIVSLAFTCQHDKPIGWIFECADLKYKEVSQINITKLLADDGTNNNKSDQVYTLELTFPVDLQNTAPKNFSCAENSNVSTTEQITSVFFNDWKENFIDSGSNFSFHIHNTKVNKTCSENSVETHPQIGCPVYINFDTHSQTYECSDSNWTTQFVDCSPSLHYCSSYINPNLEKCIRQSRNRTIYKFKLKTAIGIIQCRSISDGTTTNLETLIFLSHWGIAVAKPSLYTSVNEIGFSENILKVKKSPGRARDELFVGQEVKFMCVGYKPIFFKGFKWITKYQNGSEKYHGNNTGITHITLNSFSMSYPNLIIEERSFRMESNTSAVICQALRYDSMESEMQWVTTELAVNVSSLDFVVKVPYNITSFTYYEKGQNFIFQCTATGYPIPNTCVSTREHKGGPESNYKTHPAVSSCDKNSIVEISVPKSSVYGTLTAVCSGNNGIGDGMQEELILNNSFFTQDDEEIGSRMVDENTSNYLAVAIAAGIFALSLISVITGLAIKVGKMGKKLHVSERELEEFHEGCENALNCKKSTECYELPPYNRKFEIAREKVRFRGDILGSGQFGVVIRGEIDGKTVAVKIIREVTDIIYFKALLSEIEILIYVGYHPHIVNLTGACTKRIKQLDVLLIMDFCENGNLANFLKAQRPNFVDMFATEDRNATRPEYANVWTLTTRELIRFSCEIADAMSFIVEKNILHGDIAGRNVLVTGDMHVKLCDFGMSKQLCDNLVYVQKKQVPMPVKWMAIETLRDLKFSIESDIWSFGILLWEIFSLAEIPYDGIPWDYQSWMLLQDGYRLGKPSYSNNSIYKLMNNCWESDGKNRPRFKAILEILRCELEMVGYGSENMENSYKILECEDKEIVKAQNGD